MAATASVIRTRRGIALGLLRTLSVKVHGGNAILEKFSASTGTIAAGPFGMDEHQDDLEPEVEEGAEWETESYTPEPSEGEVTDEPEHELEGDSPAEPDDEHPDEIQQTGASCPTPTRSSRDRS